MEGFLQSGKRRVPSRVGIRQVFCRATSLVKVALADDSIPKYMDGYEMFERGCIYHSLLWIEPQ